MINVDKIYVIALRERKPQISAEMNKYGLSYEMIDAVVDDNGIAGLQYSMEKVIRNALGKAFDKIMVIEDDCVFECEQPVEKINKCISELPDNWDCLQLGANLVTPPIDYSEHLYKVYYSLSTHCVIYSNHALQEILFILDKKNHLDGLIHKYIQQKGNSFCSKECIATQRDGYSFIEKKHVNYGTMMKNKYKKWMPQ